MKSDPSRLELLEFEMDARRALERPGSTHSLRTGPVPAQMPAIWRPASLGIAVLSLVLRAKISG